MVTPYLDRLAAWDRGAATVRPRVRARFEPPTDRRAPSAPGALDALVDAPLDGPLDTPRDVAAHDDDPLAAVADDAPVIAPPRPPLARHSRPTSPAPVPPGDRTAAPASTPRNGPPEFGDAGAVAVAVAFAAGGSPPDPGRRGQTLSDGLPAGLAPARPGRPEPAATTDPASPTGRTGGPPPPAAGSDRSGGLLPAASAGLTSRSDRGGDARPAAPVDPAWPSVRPEGPRPAAASVGSAAVPSSVDPPAPAGRFGDGRATPAEPVRGASPPRRRGTDAPEPPVVHVQIDRIIVRVRDEAPTPPAAPTRRPDQPRPSRLADYLDARVRRAR